MVKNSRYVLYIIMYIFPLLLRVRAAAARAVLLANRIAA